MRETAIVAVPEASVHKDDHFPSWKDKVRASGKVVIVKAVSVSKSVSELSHSELRGRVFALDAAHVLAARCDGDAVHFAECTSFPARCSSGGSPGSFLGKRVGDLVVCLAEEGLSNVVGQCRCEERWDGVAYLFVLADSAAVEAVVVRE